MARASAQHVLALLAALAMGGAAAQQPHTQHTFKLAGAEPASATLADVGWLVGSWTGDAFGGTFEEVWNPPSAGTMVGMFKVLSDDGEVWFYELLLLAEEEGTLRIKVKHFNPDFSAWEDKTEHVTFNLVAIEPDAIHFSGLSFYRIDDDEFHGYIVLREGEELREEKLVYRRATRG